MITQTELIKISGWSKPQLHTVLLGKSITDVIAFRRNMQIALAEYSRHNKYDDVQSATLAIISQAERWARQAYYAKRLPEVLRTDTRLLKKGKASAKAIIAKEWEAILKSNSY